MLPASPRKKLKSLSLEGIVNPKTSITCSNVPEELFDAATVKKHFSKFGRVVKIRLFPKREVCVIEYDQPAAVEQALLNAGAFDGFMFDVTRVKSKVRRKSKTDEDDPTWVPDPEIEAELSAMSGTPTYRVTRQKPMDIAPVVHMPKMLTKLAKPIRKLVKVKEKPVAVIPQIKSSVEPSVPMSVTQTSLSTYEAAAELHQLKSKVSSTPDEQWRILDARDRILRGWGGAGSRVKIGGATIGTCFDMCPEKELLHRQAEHQVVTLETYEDSDGQMEPWRAVKQYSRSSADQEIPMCYELRPAPVLMRTCSYLLHEIADTKRQVSLADWFHFMWDRFRGIRKDITQQALCCAESICLVEMCARFHAHCAARLADLEHTQFDQKLNTDNLTKCLQTLKHMYSDVSQEEKPNEAEFRGYIALLNLGDANFWWEIKQLPTKIQKSAPITFSIKIFNALDNNNYVRFFRLIKSEATYLQACILLRYFNDVRARALARIVKAYAPRGGSRFPVEDLMNSLAFETDHKVVSFINHYGLRYAKIDEYEPAIILDRNDFIEDSDPFPISRAINLIESKRQKTVGEVIAGGQLPPPNYTKHIISSSFNRDGKLKETALYAEDQGYNTINDSNKDVQALKQEIQRLSQGGKVNTESKLNLFLKQEPKPVNSHLKISAPMGSPKQFSFNPAIPVASTDVIKNSPDKILETNNLFSFSKPQAAVSTINQKDPGNLFAKSAFNKPTFSDIKGPFGNKPSENNPFHNLLKGNKSNDSVFNKPESSMFGQPRKEHGDANKNLFSQPTGSQNKSLFSKNDNNKDQGFGNKNIFASTRENLFTKPDSTVTIEKNTSIFAKPAMAYGNNTKIPSVFALSEPTNVFSNSNSESKSHSIFTPNGDTPSNVSPGSLFKSVFNSTNGPDTKKYSIFQSKNKAQTVADNILNSINDVNSHTAYDFNHSEDEIQKQSEIQKLHEDRVRQEKIKEEQRISWQKKIDEAKSKHEELKRNEQIRIVEAEKKKQEEEKRKLEEERRKLEEESRKIEEFNKAEELRKAQEKEAKFKELVEMESNELVDELVTLENNDTIRNIMKEEMQLYDDLIKHANDVTETLLQDLCTDTCKSELQAEKFLTLRIMRKWFDIWKNKLIRNRKRRRLLEDAPVWLTDRTPLEEATILRRFVERDALKNMNAFHRGYKFIGEVKQLPPPEPFNVMEIIRSPLLKRMKQINYPYDKCFFWKVTLVSPGDNKWLFRKINLEKWLLDAFSDKKKHEESESLIHVGKQSWNHLMEFAISVSLINKEKFSFITEAIEGTNGIVFFAIENDDFLKTIKNTIKQKYPYQLLPVAVLMPSLPDQCMSMEIQSLLVSYVNSKHISAFKIFLIDSQNIAQTLNAAIKRALKWLAKKCPQNPPIEIDLIKSMCQRYLGNEIWCKFRTENDCRMDTVLKDLKEIVNLYNAAVEKLTEVITDDTLFNYSSFPLEFKKYLDESSPYPKPYEFVPSSVKNSDNISAIKNIMCQLKLPSPSLKFNPSNTTNMQQQIRMYCNQICWFENPEQVVCKVIATLPNEFSLDMTSESYRNSFQSFNLIDFLNVIVYEKINSLKNFNNCYAVYKVSVLHEYQNTNWLYDVAVLKNTKHRVLDYEDDMGYYIEAKRRKIELDSMEYLVLEDNDKTLVEENMKEMDANISKINDCTEAVNQLEREIEMEKMKSIEFENMLMNALANGYE